jgi:hypothetical protein
MGNEIRFREKGRWWSWVGLGDVWTTVGRTIYFPRPQWVSRRLATVEHEIVHVEQWRKWGPLLWLTYLLGLPLPIGLAWFRYRWEREAYLVQLDAGASPEDIVDVLCGPLYLWCWPKPWALRWFRAQQNRKV